MNYLKSFPALEGLADLANRDNVDINPTLLRVLTDLYVAKSTHSSDEERQYTELALRLIETVDVSVRQQLARQLASYAMAPLPVVQRLARDVIAVAEPILRHSPRLTSAELRSLAPNASPAHVAAIAAHGRIDTHEQFGGAITSGQPAIGSSEAANELSEMFFAANSTERRLMLLNLDYVPLPAGKPIAPQSAGEAVRRLEAAALAHNVQTFVRELAHALAISYENAQRLSNDPSGEPLVIAARALSMPADVLQRILLCLNPVIGQSVQRVYELADLYEALKTEAALRMIAIWQTTEQRPPRSMHQPQYWNDQARARPDAASAAQRPTSAGAPDQRINTKRG